MHCSPHNKELTGSQATVKWYSDICDRGYDFKSKDIQRGTGHMTEVVWLSARYLGIGKALTKKNGMLCTIVVARYQPQGNVQGEFQENVLEGDFDNSICAKIQKYLP